jgi:hypothetical protein
VPADEIIDARWISTPARLKSGLGTAAVIVMDQVDRHHQGDLPGSRLLLQARKLRPVHAVPRRHRLDVARDGPHGEGEAEKSEEIDMLLDVTKQVEGHTICALGRCGGLADPGPDPSLPSGNRTR